ncbi:hypothetical protein DC487_06890 [Sphingobacterium corticibacter]|uniref:Uncharacterized protein n=1 Tax=Sphingobacterium corticibacter TaxID=2171749 RepID=A0A2T8HJT7_9SPHI|nr:hypothetical protein DC487_06890 [Sphingobacterium corticibacter]
MKKQLKTIAVGLGSTGLLVACLFLAKPTEISAAALMNVESLKNISSGKCTGPKNTDTTNCESRNTNDCSDMTGCNSVSESE